METIDKGKILKDNWNKIAKLTRLRKLTSKQKAELNFRIWCQNCFACGKEIDAIEGILWINEKEGRK
jgi:hypothetical protein